MDLVAARTVSFPNPVGWPVVLGSLALGLIGCVAGARVWRGQSINPRNDRVVEDRFGFLTVTLLPSSAIFLAWFLIGLLSQIGPHIHGTALRLLVLILILVLGLVSLIAFLLAASLFFVFKPRWMVPPHLRKLNGKK